MLVDRDESFGIALFLIDEKDHGFDWMPDSVPPDFMLERGPADTVFVEAAGRLGLAGMNSDWHRVSAISRRLLSNPNLVGIPACAWAFSFDGYGGHTSQAGTNDPLALIECLDLKTYLGGDISTKVDRARMVSSLEVPRPQMDHELVEWLDTPNRWPAVREAGLCFVEEERNWTGSVGLYITPHNSLRSDC